MTPRQRLMFELIWTRINSLSLEREFMAGDFAYISLKPFKGALRTYGVRITENHDGILYSRSRYRLEREDRNTVRVSHGTPRGEVLLAVVAAAKMAGMLKDNRPERKKTL